MDTLLWAFVGYVIGSIPFGLLLTRTAGFGDIRAIGSGSIGATNVLRTGNKKIAFATLVLDSAKGAVAVLSAKYLADFDAALVAGFCALLGHIFPVWLKFRGGKGVATAFGIVLVLAPQVGLISASAWLMSAALTRYSSLSALIATAVAPVAAWGFGFGDKMPAICAFISTIIWFKHRDNIKRLLDGSEPKIGAKS